jgi:hypothetical protein
LPKWDPSEPLKERIHRQRAAIVEDVV